MDDFNVGVTLGTGSFGRVRFAIEKVSFKKKKTKRENKNNSLFYVFSQISPVLPLRAVFVRSSLHGGVLIFILCPFKCFYIVATTN